MQLFKADQCLNMTNRPGFSAVLVLLVGAAYWSGVECFSSGAPEGACSTLAPLEIAHLGSAQSSQVPYEVNLTSLDAGNGGFAYMPGVAYSCTYNSNNALNCYTVNPPDKGHSKTN